MKNLALKYNLLLIILCLSSSFLSQNEEDALRLSNLHFGGTARYISVGGAFGSLGADISVLSINPAGMARFKKSEFSFSPNVTLSGSSSYLDSASNSTISGKENLNVGSFGIVGVSKNKSENNSKWTSFQFGFSYNRLADFNEKFELNGNSNYSMSHVFALRSNGISTQDLIDYDPFYGELAYQTYITDFDSLSNNYQSIMNSQSIAHEQTTTRKGRVGEYSIAFSGNYNQKFYVGGSIGLPKVHFEEEKRHTETEIKDSSEFEHSFTFNEYQLTTGNGINGKIGVIFLPSNWLRFGIAYHTKTFYNLNDYWNTSMNSVISDSEQHSHNSIDGNYNYKLSTPNKLIASSSVIIAKKALISIDYTRIDHSSSILKPNTFFGSNYSFEAENNAIDSNYRVSNNIQIGTEIKIGDFYMIRAGFSSFQNPFSFNTDATYNKNSFSAGLGYRNKKYFIDLGARYSTWKDNYYMYDSSIAPASRIDNNALNITVTCGFKW